MVPEKVSLTGCWKKRSLNLLPLVATHSSSPWQFTVNGIKILLHNMGVVLGGRKNKERSEQMLLKQNLTPEELQESKFLFVL